MLVLDSLDKDDSELSDELDSELSLDSDDSELTELVELSELSELELVLDALAACRVVVSVTTYLRQTDNFPVNKVSAAITIVR